MRFFMLVCLQKDSNNAVVSQCLIVFIVADSQKFEYSTVFIVQHLWRQTNILACASLKGTTSLYLGCVIWFFVEKNNCLAKCSKKCLLQEKNYP